MFLFSFFVLPSLFLPAIRVVDKLPGANKLLLQHLVCVLHHIQENADTNKMDAYNLAVCIAPTLLQLDDTPLVEQKGKLEKVTSLVLIILSQFGTLKLCGSQCRKTSKGVKSKVTLAGILLLFV